MTQEAKRRDNAASGKKNPRLKERFGKAGEQIANAAGSVADGVVKAAGAFKGTTLREVGDFATEVAQRGVGLVKPLGKEITDFIGDVGRELAGDIPPKPASMELNEFCHAHDYSRASYQVTREMDKGSHEVLFVASVVVKDAAHKTHTSKKCKAPLEKAAIEEAARDLLEKLKVYEQ